MARVTGLGGIFFKSRDPKALAAWYAKHLGLPVTDFGGAMFVEDEKRGDLGREQPAQPRDLASPSRFSVLPPRFTSRPCISRRVGWLCAGERSRLDPSSLILHQNALPAATRRSISS